MTTDSEPFSIRLYDAMVVGGEMPLKHQLLVCLLLEALCLQQAYADRVILDFESLPYREQYGRQSGDNPGDLAFGQSGVDVFLRDFQGFGGTSFNTASVAVSGFGGFGLNISNINLEFDFTKLDFTVDKVMFEFYHGGGVENLGVNDELLGPRLLPLMPPTIGNASVSVTPGWMSGGHVSGVVTIEGAIERLTIGGQEFSIDNVIVTGPGPAPADFNDDGSVDGSDYRLWQVTYGLTSLLAADGNDDGVVDAADYTIWRDAMDANALASSAPEPGSLLLAVAALSCSMRFKPR